MPQLESPHTLAHALGRTCACTLREMLRCVICGRELKLQREHVDTCGEKCFRALLKLQQRGLL